MANDFLERQLGGLTLRIDRGQCIATGNCLRVAGDAFVLDGRRICSFADVPTDANRERLIEACRVCPVQALAVFDENGRQIVP